MNMINVLPKNISEYLKGCLIPQVPLDEWIAQYEIPTRPMNCPVCSRELSPLAPFALNSSRGIIYPKNQAPTRLGSSTKIKKLVDYLD